MIGVSSSVKREAGVPVLAWGSVWDWVKYLATPFPGHLRDMGYARELRQLGSRKERCQAAWRPHLERTRSLILEAVDRCSRYDKVVIVGSGLLFDIPVAELSKRFREVTLVDILHLWQVRTAVSAYSNVRLHPVDITGVVKEVHAAARGGGALQMSECKPEFFLNDGIDLVVSANILSQLPVLPNGYASRWLNRRSPEQVKGFSRGLVINHLDWLASFTGNVCLIADLERLHCDGEKVVRREQSLWGVELPEGGQEWMWELAPRPEIEWNRDIRHRVVGYAEFPKRVWLDQPSTKAGA
jgi:hypothetical protein